MIRIALLDDHPAVRAGLEAILERQPDLVLVGAAANDWELWPLLYRTRPDVVILDYDHPGRDGVTLCLRIKATAPAPGVVLYSASAERELIVPATVAGADAIVDKASEAQELLGAVRTVARGESALPPISLRLKAETAAKLQPEDHAIFAMRLAGTPPGEIAHTLGLTAAQLAKRTAAIFRVLTDRARRSAPHPLSPEPALGG
jgi:DNA-binding NarL/FixJ family response regulator